MPCRLCFFVLFFHFPFSWAMPFTPFLSLPITICSLFLYYIHARTFWVLVFVGLNRFSCRYALSHYRWLLQTQLYFVLCISSSFLARFCFAFFSLSVCQSLSGSSLSLGLSLSLFIFLTSSCPFSHSVFIVPFIHSHSVSLLHSLFH